MKAKTHYEVLGVSKTADQTEIKSAYRKLAAQWHPDKHFGDVNVEEKFKSIVLAHSVLSDPSKRQAYDLGFSIDGIFDPTDITATLDPDAFLKTIQDLVGKYIDGKVANRFDRDPSRTRPAKQKVCKACDGQGRVPLRQGRVAVYVACTSCRARVG